MPTTNVGDDLTWTKGKHTITAGIDFRFIRNTHLNYVNSFPSYAFNRNTLGGLGGDATAAVTNYVNSLLGATDLKLTQTTAVQNGLGILLGLINDYGATYQYTKAGSVIPFGTAADREYAVNDYEEYVMDSWRVRLESHHHRRIALQQLHGSVGGQRNGSGYHRATAELFRESRRRYECGHS